MLVVNTTRVNTWTLLPLLDNSCRLRFSFLVVVLVDTTRVTTSDFGLFNEFAGYWYFNGFGFSLREETSRSATELAESRAPVDGLDVDDGRPGSKLGNALSTCNDLRGSDRGSNGGTVNRGGQHQGGKEKSRG
jgi:hypothetical protein